MLFITGNQNKLREAQAIIPSMTSQKIDLPELQSLDPKEIVMHKLEQAIKLVDGPLIVEDTSLHLHALGGFPGPLVKRALEHEGAVGIWRLLADYEDKSATAQCTIGYRDGSQIHIITGQCKGHIVSPAGETDFGRDPIFQPDGYDQTFGQMSSSLKNSISHRHHALQRLGELIT